MLSLVCVNVVIIITDNIGPLLSVAAFLKLHFIYLSSSRDLTFFTITVDRKPLLSKMPFTVIYFTKGFSACPYLREMPLPPQIQKALYIVIFPV